MLIRRLTLPLLTAALLPALASAHAEKSNTLSSLFPDKASLQYIAPSGAIRHGEVVAILDCTPITKALKELHNELEDAERELKAAEEKLTVSEAILKEKVENATETVTDAERNLAKYTENDAPGTEVALKLALHDAETEYKKQEERYSSRDRLLSEGFIHKVEYDNEETRLKRTQLALEAAKLKMAAFQKYEREAQQAQLNQTLKQAKEELARLEKEAITSHAELIKKAATARKAVDSLQSTQTKLTERLNKTIIRAHKSGQFVPASSADEAAPARGDLIGMGQTIGYIEE